MSQLYEKLAALSAKVVPSFGRPVTLHKAVPGSLDLVTGGRTAPRQPIQTHAIIANSTGKLMSDVRMVGNCANMTTDIEVVFPPTDTINGVVQPIVIDDDDKIEFDGIVYGILKILPVAPGGQLLLTKVVVRR